MCEVRVGAEVARLALFLWTDSMPVEPADIDWVSARVDEEDVAVAELQRRRMVV